MKVLSKIWNSFLDLFGLRKNSKYVTNYLNHANMRSGAFMAFIIVILEAWLIIRQHDKYIIPTMQAGAPAYAALGNPLHVYINVLFDNTSLFWLFMVMGIAMFIYCVLYEKKKSLAQVIAVIAISGVGIVLCCMFPFESSIRNWKESRYMNNALLIAFYISMFLFHVAMIVATLYQYKKKKNNAAITSVLVISLFALSCLIFGVRVSYGDYFSTSSNKQIICFLMFSIYVGCLLIWRPVISIGMLGAIFLGFYYMLEYAKTGNMREWSDGDKVNYITFFISLAMVCISIYNQRLHEAKKDEELEKLATQDTLTGLMSFQYFINQSGAIIKDKNTQRTDYMFVFINITSFKIFNDQRGFEAGNVFLKQVGQILQETFADDLVSRQGDDHFVLFCKKENIEEKLKDADRKVMMIDMDIKPGIKAGSYILKNKIEEPRRMVEKARYACSEIKYDGSIDYIEYDQKMHDSYHLIQYVIRHIDDAAANGYIKPYYQPVVWSKNEKLCGVEALARWIDPRYGFMNPAAFVGALESSQLIYKLDIAMLRLVCADLKHNKEAGLPVIPVSINFSRMDFTIIDVADTVESILNEYGIEKELVHVEITESALQSQGDVLLSSMKKLKEKGFALWLDDFGSGYSSLNALKDYDFDVMKLDMEFLKGFENKPKAKFIIKSAIAIAKDVDMRTLCEGVETREQVDFLRENNCERLQGYFFGKPYAYDDLMKMIEEGKYILDDDILKDMKQRNKA